MSARRTPRRPYRLQDQNAQERDWCIGEGIDRIADFRVCGGPLSEVWSLRAGLLLRAGTGTLGGWIPCSVLKNNACSAGIPERGFAVTDGLIDDAGALPRASRVEAFTDGVIAIIIAILVLHLRVPIGSVGRGSHTSPGTH
jgi:hypothetical protein